jgi:hypothetical protein
MLTEEPMPRYPCNAPSARTLQQTPDGGAWEPPLPDHVPDDEYDPAPAPVSDHGAEQED